jgi:hypothetical protein
MTLDLRLDFAANSYAQFKTEKDAFLQPSTSKKSARERKSLIQLLESLVPNGEIEFPLTIRQREAPDFEIHSGGNRFSVEATLLTSPNLEHARALQMQGFGRTLHVSEFLRDEPKLGKAEVAQRAFAVQALDYGNSVSDREHFWRQQFDEILRKKSAIQSKPNFLHGNEDWLLVWDQTRADAQRMKQRFPDLKDRLSSHWKPGWFTRVFVQDEHFGWLVTCSRSSIVLLKT